MSDYDLINGEILTVTVTVDEETVIANINTAARGPAGADGSGTNSVTSATTSDGTAALYLDSIRFEATNGGPTQLGEMAWESTDGSIDAMLESGVIVAMGEDVMIRVRNTTASPITKGTALAYDGTSGASGRIKVKPWVGANISTAKLFLGFAACDMPANSNGYSQWFGKLAQINTSGGAQTWLDEQIIYAVPGASATITNVAPTSGEYAAAAVVINAGSGTSGILFVRPTLEVASSTSATANTLVLRDGSGGASFAGIALSGLNTNSGSYSQVGGTNFNVATTTAANLTATGSGIVTVSGEGGTTISGGTLTFSPSGFAYGTGAASAHRIALGAGTTGSALFGADNPAAARTTLELGTINSPTFATVVVGDGSNSTPSITIGSATNGIYRYTHGNYGAGITYTISASSRAAVFNDIFLFRSDVSIGWASSSIIVAADATISRKSAGIIRFGTNTANSLGSWEATNGVLLGTTASTSTTTGALIVSGGVGIAGNINAGGSIAATGTVKTGGYTFATLPTPTQGMRTFITDGAALPIYMANAASGGSTVTPVFYNGTNWINA